MEKLNSTEEAAERIRLRPQTLRSYRSKGGGPDFIKLAPNRVAYRTSDLEKWVESRRRRSTADPGPGTA
jgi:predicted DNA-binding transcriptional regulator AlpA